MPAEVLQKVCTTFDGSVKVEALHAAGAAGNKTVTLGEDHRGLVVGFYQAGRHNTHHTLVPGGVVYDGGVLRGQGTAARNHLQGFLRDFAVDGLALVVVVVDFLADFPGRPFIGGRKELHRQPAAFHSSCRIDAGADLEDDVVNADVAGLQLGKADHGQQALTRVLVEALEAVVGQDAVFSGHGHQVRGDGDYLQIQQGFQQGGVQSIVLHIALGQFEAHSATTEVVEGIVAVFPFGIQYGHGLGQLVFRKVVVTDDDVDALGTGILYFLDGLDAAVQGDDEVDAVVGGPVQGLVREAVAFVVAVRDIEGKLLGKVLEEGVHLGDGGGAVHVIVSIYQDFLGIHDGLMQTLHGLVHVFHEEGIVQVFQGRAEEFAGVLKGFHAALDQEAGQDTVYTELCCQPGGFFLAGRCFDDPLFLCTVAHIFTKIGNLRQIYKQEMIISSVISSGLRPSVSMVIWAAARYSGSRCESLSAK